MSKEFDYESATEIEKVAYKIGFEAGEREANQNSQDDLEDKYDQGYADGRNDLVRTSDTIAEALKLALDGHGALALIEFERALGGGNAMPLEAELRRRGMLLPKATRAV